MSKHLFSNYSMRSLNGWMTPGLWISWTRLNIDSYDNNLDHEIIKCHFLSFRAVFSSDHVNIAIKNYRCHNSFFGPYPLLRYFLGGYELSAAFTGRYQLLLNSKQSMAQLFKARIVRSFPWFSSKPNATCFSGTGSIVQYWLFRLDVRNYSSKYSRYHTST